MNFTDAIKNQSARTINGMKARKSTADSCVDLFFKIGASRGKNIIPEFVAVISENEEVAVRIALWARDVRGGAGERQIFRDILKYIERTDFVISKKIADKVSEIGRWDDLFAFETMEMQEYSFKLIKDALENKNGLAAKWCPRKGPIANSLRKYLGMTPYDYRKTIVNLTKVVENQMCKNQWNNINFSQVPSVASARYKSAFNRHTPNYAEYVNKLVNKDSGVKVNASAIFPHDVLKGLGSAFNLNYNNTELDFVTAQWKSLPDYIGNENILPVVDVSGSMNCEAGGNRNLLCIDVAVSLGLYLADKNKGKFNGSFLTFSSDPELIHLNGNIVQKIQQMVKSKWGMSTNLHSAFNKILSVAIENNVPKEEMPETLIIFSDMQFNSCVKYDDSAIEMIKRKYIESGYDIPKVIFWNINAYENVPVKFDESGVALVSGYSPSILKAILNNNFEEFTPYNIMMNTIMNERYNF